MRLSNFCCRADEDAAGDVIGKAEAGAGAADRAGGLVEIVDCEHPEEIEDVLCRNFSLADRAMSRRSRLVDVGFSWPCDASPVMAFC
jgi:hypothetical protein